MSWEKQQAARPTGFDNMLFLPPLILLVSGVLHGASLEDSIPTFDYKDPVSGEVLKCSMCPAGHHMVRPCNATTPTQCAPCPKNHYTEISNYLSECLYCNNYCTHNHEVQEECSPVKNRVCRCRDGFYEVMEFCFMHSECRPGHGVLRKGTSQSNTECEECSDGFFSSSSSATEACSEHKTCASNETVLLAGSSNTDTLCGTCQDLAEGGELLRKFFLHFFSTHKICVRNLKRFVRNGQKPHAEALAGVSPMTTIRKWIKNSPDEQLWKLTQMLTTARLKPLAKKLTKKFKWIENRSQNCTLTSRMLE